MTATTRLTLAALAGLILAPSALAADAPAPKYKYPTTRTVNLKPLPEGVKAGSVMAPMSRGDCGICHVSSDPKNPGPAKKPGNVLCLTCHEEFEAILARPVKHPPALQQCVACHNPHNSREKKLLHEDIAAQCFDCHKDIKQYVETAKVKHGALTTNRKCANCHNPHGTNIAKLLTAMPFDQCVGCHSVDNMKDWNGVTLANFKQQLEENGVWHKPVAAKDCSACHRTHGGPNYRLLVAPYPDQFYANYEPTTYALCYGCHNDKVVSAQETRTLTRFRDGSKNLHYVHVNKAERGRSCRACHEIHASKQERRIRDGVPFGKEGWVLKCNFTKTPTGGMCTKTCHEARTYTNKTVSASAAPSP
jgi:predicted CXXCH cytochrome family protein